MVSSNYHNSIGYAFLLTNVPYNYENIRLVLSDHCKGIIQNDNHRFIGYDYEASFDGLIL